MKSDTNKREQLTADLVADLEPLPGPVKHGRKASCGFVGPQSQLLD